MYRGQVYRADVQKGGVQGVWAHKDFHGSWMYEKCVHARFSTCTVAQYPLGLCASLSHDSFCCCMSFFPYICCICCVVGATLGSLCPNLHLFGAPAAQDLCNGLYSRTADKVEGHAVYHKGFGGSLRRLFWTPQFGGGWSCRTSTGQVGFIPSPQPAAVSTLSATWLSNSGWAAAASGVRCSSECPSLQLVGAPQSQSACNGVYHMTSNRIGGHAVYHKQHEGLDLYLYWTPQDGGVWLCTQRHTANVVGRVPSEVAQETIYHSADWFVDGEGVGTEWVVTSAAVLCPVQCPDLQLWGAPDAQQSCNGFYSRALDQAGRIVYHKHDAGSGVRYVYWSPADEGGWVCDDDTDPAVVRGFIPSPSRQLVSSSFALWIVGTQAVRGNGTLECPHLVLSGPAAPQCSGLFTRTDVRTLTGHSYYLRPRNAYLYWDAYVKRWRCESWDESDILQMAVEVSNFTTATVATPVTAAVQTAQRWIPVASFEFYCPRRRPCAEDQRVESNTCVPCPPGTTNAAGDNAEGPDTWCRPVRCAPNQRVVARACVDCPPGLAKSAGDVASGPDTRCDQCADQPTAPWDVECPRYAANEWCTPSGGYGPGWPASMGSFADHASGGVDATQACCACGGGTHGYFYVMGDNRYGQLGLGTAAVNVTVPQRVAVPTGRPVSVLSLGAHNTGFVAGGQLYVMGRNTYGALGLGDRQHRRGPALLAPPNNAAVSAVSWGLHHAAFVAGGRLFVTGFNANGQLGLGHTRDTGVPQPVAAPGPVFAVALGLNYSTFLVRPARRCGFEAAAPLSTRTFCGLWTTGGPDGAAESVWRSMSGGATPSASTGPGRGPAGRGYVYVEASAPNVPGNVLRLTSNAGDYSGIGFKYHMYGAHSGALAVLAEAADGSWTEYWGVEGQQHGSAAASWSETHVAFNRSARRVQFRAVVGSGINSDIALADLVLVTAEGLRQTCAFPTEAYGFCGALWVTGGAEFGGDVCWRWHAGDAGAPNADTGPRWGPGDAGYVYADASSGAGAVSQLISRRGGYAGVRFKYHMYGADTGSLAVYVQGPDGRWSERWRRDGHQHPSGFAPWNEADVFFDSTAQRVRFTSVTGAGPQSGTAVADVVLYTTEGEGGLLYTMGFFAHRFTIPQLHEPANGKTVTAVAAADWHFAFIAGGQLYTVGDPGNAMGALGRFSPDTGGPVVSPNRAAVSDVALGWQSSAFAAGGQWFVMGRSGFGQLGLSHVEVVTLPSRFPPHPRNVTRLALGRSHSLHAAHGEVYALGSNRYGQLAQSSPGPFHVAQVLQSPDRQAIVYFAAGAHHSAFVTLSPNQPRSGPNPPRSPSPTPRGQWYVMGLNRDGELGIGSNAEFVTRALPLEPPNGQPIAAVDFGGQHSGLIAGGMLFVAGSGAAGQLGLGRPGTSQSTLQPLECPSGEVVSAIALGHAHTAFLDALGHMYVMGSNEYGQLGLGPEAVPHNQYAPRRVGFARPISAIAARFWQTAFIADGALYVMGRNNHGQLGLGHRVSQASPHRVASPNGQGISAVAFGSSHGAFIAGGELFVFGSNYHRQLGPAAPAASEWEAAPRRLPSPNGAAVEGVVLGSGLTSFCAAGAHYVVGYFGNGQAGLGAVAQTSVPMRVPSPNGYAIAVVAHGYYHSALVAGGELFTMGSNEHGQAGLGPSREAMNLHPTLVAPDNRMAVTAVVANGDHTAFCAEATFSPSATPTSSATASASPSHSKSGTPTRPPTPSPTPTSGPSATPTQSATATASRTLSPTQSATAPHTRSLTATATVVPSATPTPTATAGVPLCSPGGGRGRSGGRGAGGRRPEVRGDPRDGRRVLGAHDQKRCAAVGESGRNRQTEARRGM